jgi:hypothetical protein
MVHLLADVESTIAMSKGIMLAVSLGAALLLSLR